MLRWIKKRREREAEESRERGEQFAARLAAAEQEVKDNEAAMLFKACVLRDPQIGWNCLGPHCVHFHAGSVQRKLIFPVPLGVDPWYVSITHPRCKLWSDC